MAKEKIIGMNEDGDVITAPSQIEEKKGDVILDEAPKKPKTPENYVFRLVATFDSTVGGKQYPPTWNLKNQDVVFDDVTGTERAIRYLEGVSTIWMDEQEKLPENVVKRRPLIIFKDGYLRTPAIKTALIKFLTTSNMWNKKKNKLPNTHVVYELLDFADMEAQELKASSKRFEAMKVAMSATPEEMIPHAKFLNINFINSEGEKRGNDAIMVDYCSWAEKNPEYFIKTFSNPLVNAQYLVSLAFDNGMLSTSVIKGQVHWAKTKKMILQLPDGADANRFLAEYCLTPDGKETYDKLKTVASA